MNKTEIREAIINYLDLVERGCGDQVENLRALQQSLKSLAEATSYDLSNVASTENVNFPDAPKQDYQTLRLLAEQRFPDFGYYDISSEGPTSAAITSIGDALDDIADITMDLHEVLWRWENNNSEDALWHLHFFYISHLKEHLQSLSSYVGAYVRSKQALPDRHFEQSHRPSDNSSDDRTV